MALTLVYPYFVDTFYALFPDIIGLAVIDKGDHLSVEAYLSTGKRLTKGYTKTEWGRLNKKQKIYQGIDFIHLICDRGLS